MKRRRFVVGLGGLAAGSSALLGTGAFTSVTSTRGVDVQVVNEGSDAYLKMVPSSDPNGVFAKNTAGGYQGELQLDFDGEIPDEDAGSGLGTDSVYDFDSVFEVTNQGTQTVYLDASFSDPEGENTTLSADEKIDIYFYAGSNSGTPIDGTDGELRLNVGESGSIGVHVETNEAPIDVQQVTATITADGNSTASTTF